MFYSRIIGTKFWRQKLQSWLLGLKFLALKFCTKKRVCKTLMKLTPDYECHKRNILCERFLQPWFKKKYLFCLDFCHFLTKNFLSLKKRKSSVTKNDDTKKMIAIIPKNDKFEFSLFYYLDT